MTNPAAVVDAYVVHRFALEIENVHVAGFGELSGLQVQTEVFEYKEGGLNTYAHKLPGRTTYGNLTLKWGSTDNYKLWDWYHAIMTDQKLGPLKKSVSVIQFDGQHSELRRWNLSGAFPIKWVGPSFNTATSQVAIETLELAFAEFVMVAKVA